ncbi:MAG: hypothetical protein AAF570_03910 [Bacteroidota bacterium]
MGQIGTRKRRCEECHNWTVGNRYYCDHCGAVMDKRSRDRRLKKIAELKAAREKRAAENNLPPVRRFVAKFFRIVEAIYMGIIGFIAWLLFWLGG